MIGETLGPYRLLEQIGAGGMATVYKAYDTAFDRTVALKLLPAQYYHDEKFRKRFAREARAIARLEHLHILPVHAAGEERGYMYLAMRLMTTGSLADYLQQSGPLPLAVAARLTRQIGSALDYAHAAGVLHRDVKPGNVLLDESRNAYLTDFGIAKVVEDETLTATGVIVGTPAYMAPEQCMGSDSVTPAADQYSLGVILYEMLTGRTPFVAETPMAVVLKQMHDPLPLPRQFRPEMPGKVQRVLLKALAKQPDQRYLHCTALADALDEAITQPDFVDEADLPVFEAQAEPLSLIEETAAAIPQAQPTRVSARRRGWGWIAMPLGLIGVAVIAGIIFSSTGGSPAAPTQPAIAAVPDETATSAATATLDLIGLASPADAVTATLAPGPTPLGGFEWIAYTNISSEIFVIRPDGSEERKLSDRADPIYGLYWSPDGRYLAAVYRKNSINTGVLFFDLQEGDQSEFFSGAEFPDAFWPHSETLVYSCLNQGDTVAQCAADAETGLSTAWPGGDPRAVSWPSGIPDLPAGFEVTGPARASFDRRYFAFSGNAPDEATELVIVQIVPLTTWRIRDVGWSNTWSWSPTEARIVLMMPVDGVADIFTVTPGTEPVNLTNHVAPDRFPVWSPDGQMIAFNSSRQTENELYLMNSDGSGLRRLPTSGPAVTPAWAP